MSCSILWEPVKDRPAKQFDGTSRMWDALCKAFNLEPQGSLVLGLKDVHVLRAMAAANPVNGFYDSIANAIEQNERIRVWVDY